MYVCMYVCMYVGRQVGMYVSMRVSDDFPEPFDKLFIIKQKVCDRQTPPSLTNDVSKCFDDK